jgi:hypothetical protein
MSYDTRKSTTDDNYSLRASQYVYKPGKKVGAGSPLLE